MNDQSQQGFQDPVFGEVISSYSQDQAIEDGVLVFVGYAGRERVVFTRTLFDEGYEDEMLRKTLVKRGLSLLREDDPEDSPTMRLRVIESDKLWVIWNSGEGVTFLKPEDY